MRRVCIYRRLSDLLAQLSMRQMAYKPGDL